MKEILKLIVCVIVAILLVNLLSPIFNLLGAIFTFLLSGWLAYALLSWLANKFDWKWWID